MGYFNFFILILSLSLDFLLSAMYLFSSQPYLPHIYLTSQLHHFSHFSLVGGWRGRLDGGAGA